MAGGGVKLYTPGVGNLKLPYLPDSIDVSEIAPVYSQQPRPGRRPILYKTGLSLPKQRFSATVADHGASIEGVLSELRQHSEGEHPTRLYLGGRKRISGPVTGLSWTEMDHDTSGRCIRAVVDVELTTKADVKINIGPVKPKKPGKHKPPAKHKPNKKPGKGKK